MAKIATDTLKYVKSMLDAVDYAKITLQQWQNWIAIITSELGKHIQKRTSPPALSEVPYPLPQTFCDVINQYDFKSLNWAKRNTAIAMAKKWANDNLPLFRRIL